MTQEEIDTRTILLKDTVVRLNEIMANKLAMGMPIDDMLDTIYVAEAVVYALECSSLVYKDEHFDKLFELEDRLLLRCQKYN